MSSVTQILALCREEANTDIDQALTKRGLERFRGSLIPEISELALELGLRSDYSPRSCELRNTITSKVALLASSAQEKEALEEFAQDVVIIGLQTLVVLNLYGIGPA